MNEIARLKRQLFWGLYAPAGLFTASCISMIAIAAGADCHPADCKAEPETSHSAVLLHADEMTSSGSTLLEFDSESYELARLDPHGNLLVEVPVEHYIDLKDDTRRIEGVAIAVSGSDVQGRRLTLRDLASGDRISLVSVSARCRASIERAYGVEGVGAHAVICLEEPRRKGTTP